MTERWRLVPGMGMLCVRLQHFLERLEIYGITVRTLMLVTRRLSTSTRCILRIGLHTQRKDVLNRCLVISAVRAEDHKARRQDE
jgi:hypothetical protein